MSIAADAALLRDAPRTLMRRWGVALAAIVAGHGAAIAGALYLQGLRGEDGPPPAPVMLVLAPMATSTTTVENNQPPAPPQVKSEPEPELETPRPEEMVKAKDAEIPKPLKRPKHEKRREKPAPATTAPQAAPVIAPVAAAPVSGLSADQADAMMGWQARLRAHLERHKRYPRSAQLRGEKGMAKLRFVVDREGRVVSFSLAQSSGYAVLDEETLALIRRAEPLPAMPDDLPDQQKSFNVPIEFGLD